MPSTPEQSTLPGVSVDYIFEADIADLESPLPDITTGPWKAVRGSMFQGEDWQVADFGPFERFEDADTALITTDGVHASRLDGDAMCDAEFCAKARNLLPRLLRQYRKMQEEIQCLK